MTPSHYTRFLTVIVAPTVSPPKAPDASQHLAPGVNPYRQDLRAPQPQLFDLDLDLNPDL